MTRLTNEEKSCVVANLEKFLAAIHATPSEASAIMNAGATPIATMLARFIGQTPEYKANGLTCESFNRGLLALVAYKFGARNWTDAENVGEDKE